MTFHLGHTYAVSGLYDPDDGDTGIGGLTMQLVDQTSNAFIATQMTAADGIYTFDVTMQAGTYKIVEVFDHPTTPQVENELTELGMLDGKERPGVNGGLADNMQDTNAITGIIAGDVGPAEASAGYLFAELLPASLQGLVWEDFNDDGEVDLGEIAIDGTTITVTGTDDRDGEVNLTQSTDAQGIFELVGLRPGTYAIKETQPPAGLMSSTAEHVWPSSSE